MQYDFDQIINRRGTDCSKWGRYHPEALPLWVADMDFVSAQPIIDALHQRVSHGVFGYSMESTALTEAICERLLRLQGWAIDPASVVYIPGVVSSFNIAIRAIGDRGDGVLINTPVYPPFLTAPTNQQHTLQPAQQAYTLRDGHLHYEVDFDALENAVDETTKLFLLCSPHNPTGRAYTRQELLDLAAFCAERDIVICSDEIHCDLLLDGNEHFSIAALDPAIEARTITLIAPSKTYNIPDLGCSMAIIPNPDLRAKFEAAMAGIVPHVTALGKSGSLAAYTEGDEWLEQVLTYLTANRDFVVDYVDAHLPGIKTTVPEATYLAWLDCGEAGIEGNAHTFFLEQASVVLNDGVLFGPGGEGFVRLNFGCPRATLEQALEQMKAALALPDRSQPALTTL